MHHRCNINAVAVTPRRDDSTLRDHRAFSRNITQVHKTRGNRACIASRGRAGVTVAREPVRQTCLSVCLSGFSTALARQYMRTLSHLVTVAYGTSLYVPGQGQYVALSLAQRFWRCMLRRDGPRLRGGASRAACALAHQIVAREPDGARAGGSRGSPAGAHA